MLDGYRRGNFAPYPYEIKFWRVLLLFRVHENDVSSNHHAAGAMVFEGPWGKVDNFVNKFYIKRLQFWGWGNAVATRRRNFAPFPSLEKKVLAFLIPIQNT